MFCFTLLCYRHTEKEVILNKSNTHCERIQFNMILKMIVMILGNHLVFELTEINIVEDTTRKLSMFEIMRFGHAL